ncbi:MAG: QueT transporter family protein [Actinobacteria bacterium]|nr:QueT transporter family protein [Actinomycetota bacterium]
MSTRLLARAAAYAALYAALTLAPGLSSIAYGQVQFRVSEGLLAFAAADVAALPGLAIGTALANLASPLGLIDVVYGAALTLVAAVGMWAIGPRPWALAVPVVVNGLGVPVELALVLDLPYWPSVAFVALGEAAVMATIGAALLVVVRRYGDVLGLKPRRPLT